MSMAKRLTSQQLQQYHQDGYFMVRSLFDAEEIGVLRKSARHDKVLALPERMVVCRSSRASHKMGRIEHVLIGDQAGADGERVQAASERLELVYCEMQPGDAVFFHANTLHRSDQNKLEHPR